MDASVLLTGAKKGMHVTLSNCRGARETPFPARGGYPIDGPFLGSCDPTFTNDRTCNLDKILAPQGFFDIL